MLCYVKTKVVGLFRRFKWKSCPITIRRSGISSSYKVVSRLVDTFATVVIRWKTSQFGFRELIGSDFSAKRYDLGKRRTPPQQMYWSSCLQVYSVWIHRSVELCMHDCRDLLKISTIWLSGADRIGFLRNAVRSRQTSITRFSKCFAAALTAIESIGALINAYYSVRFCWKTAQFGSRETRIEHYGAANGYRAIEKQGKMYWCNVNHVTVP